MTPTVLIIGSNLAGLLTAYRLLPYGFRITILERNTVVDKPRSPDTPFPFFQGFHHGTWALFQELGLSWSSGTLVAAPFRTINANGHFCPLPRFRGFSRYHLGPELLLFGGLPWRDRLKLLNFLELHWEGRSGSSPISDSDTVEGWLDKAEQSPLARQGFWNPLSHFLLHCDLSQAALRPFLAVVSRYARSTHDETQMFLGALTLFDVLRETLRNLLSKQNVRFQPTPEYPSFQFPASGSEILHLPGREWLKADAYVAALDPHEILALLPDRAVTRFPQLHLMANIPAYQSAVVDLTLPGVRIPPAIFLMPRLIHWVSVHPSEKDTPACTTVQGLFHHPVQPHATKGSLPLEETWEYLQTVLRLPANLSLNACSPRVLPQALRIYPSIVGTRAFRPSSNAPIANLFFSGPWTATSLPHSFESLTLSATSCAQSVANMVFSSLR